MGEIADMMTSGVMCAMCGVYLGCDKCADMEIPMYCSEECAKDQNATINQVCKHEPPED